ncbi:MAG TPA: phosphate transport system regulatory protein PhoU [Gammaproteobacteria bacterium]|jgi:phosphate transport system protein|nr:phosphate transport system regulatory protein PhoU [Gammaproteobacteria bacterium]
MSENNLGDHISHRFDEELEAVRNQVLKMGGLVERQVASGISALIEHDHTLARVVARSDVKINALEVSIDEQCTQIIARRQPTASDLRLIISVIKTITDLERIGDEAEKLGEYALRVENEGIRARHYEQLQHLGDHVLKMLRDSLNCFAKMDVEMALLTIASDKRIDDEFESVSRNLITHMMEDPREIASVLHVTWCARALERIGDHAKNICEYVVYLVKGKDVRHISLEQVAEEVDIELDIDIEDGDK